MRFYTLPPCDEIEWPFLLVNPRTYKQLFKRKFEHAILDCGVEIFNYYPERRGYPRSFLTWWESKAKELTSIFNDKLWVTIPDVPSDYHPERWQDGRNIDITLANIEHFIAVDGVNWLPVVQSRYRDLLTYHQSCERTRELIGDYPRVAIGTVCKTRKISFIVEACKVTRAYFPKSHIHAFGLTLTALPHIVRRIDSWDSLACTMGGPRLGWRGVQSLVNSFDSFAYKFPRGRGKPTAKSKLIAIEYFKQYIERVKAYI